MPSSVEICNRALSMIGTRSTIASLTEGSAESIQCNLWYDSLRQMLLRAAPWGFARAQANLSELGRLENNTSPYPWPFKYTYPADALRVRYLLPQAPAEGIWPLANIYGQPTRANRFIVGNDLDSLSQQRKVLLANLENAQAVYIIDVADVSLFDHSFNVALSAMLAFFLTIPLSGNVAMLDRFKMIAEDLVKSARAADGNEAIASTEHTPDWIAVRGSSAVFVPTVFTLGSWYVGWEDLAWGS